MTVQVKFCGLKKADDVDVAVSLGVAAVGFVFDPESPRFISLDQAVMIRRRLPKGVAAVALFRNNSKEEVAAALSALAPAIAQFHGEETPAFCEAFGPGYWRAVPMAGATDLRAFAKAHPGAAAFLLDAHAAGEAGGQGRTFDWSKWPSDFGVPLILAGGLNAGNVGAAISQVRPYMVDVSSGIESARGVKDQGKMRSFMEAVRAANER